MDAQQLQSLYDKKSATYYANERSDILDMIPRTTERLLDVGCADGAMGLSAKETIPTLQEVVGIELYGQAANEAKSRLDKVLCGDIEAMTLALPDKYFDCIVCADVLEHLRDPETVLTNLRRHLKNNGTLIVSLPNIRHIIPVLKIITDRLEYEESGVMDKTHLRIFSLHTMKLMLKNAGFTITDVQGNYSKSWKFTLLHLFSFGLLRSFAAYQYRLVAQPTADQ